MDQYFDKKKKIINTRYAFVYVIKIWNGCKTFYLGADDYNDVLINVET